MSTATMPRWNEVAISAREVTRDAMPRRGSAGLRSISLDLLEGQLTALMGPAGAGKSALLRVLAGAESPDAGTVAAGSTVRRPIALVQPAPHAGRLRRSLARLTGGDGGSPHGGPRRFDTLAEAIAVEPALVLADEVGAGCWSGVEFERAMVLRRWTRDGRRSALLVTADPAAAAHADRVVFMERGAVVSDLERPDVAEVLASVAGQGV